MIDQSLFHYQLESSPVSATIYLGGDACAQQHVEQVARVINDLPRSTRVLRVDLHGVLSINLETLMELRGVIARWRSERSANVRFVLRTPLPRDEWPTAAIQFERAPLRLVVPSQKAALMAMVLRRQRGASRARSRVPAHQGVLRMHVTSAGAL